MFSQISSFARFLLFFFNSTEKLGYFFVSVYGFPPLKVVDREVFRDSTGEGLQKAHDR